MENSLPYTRGRKSNHPISKVLQWLAWCSEVWAEQEWSYILLCWGGDIVCIHLGSKYDDFQEKNLPWNVLEKEANFSL